MHNSELKEKAIAIEMKDDGFPIAKICKLTKLAIEEINKLFLSKLNEIS